MMLVANKEDDRDLKEGRLIGFTNAFHSERNNSIQSCRSLCHKILTSRYVDENYSSNALCFLKFFFKLDFVTATFKTFHR